MNSIAHSLVSQYLAALKTLENVCNRCPENQWDKTHDDAPFSQVVFHSLMFTDLYLSPGIKAFKDQSFHRKHPEIFRDYEELDDKIPEEVYSREEINTYLKFLQSIIRSDLSCLSEGDFNIPCSYGLKQMSTLELHIYNIRHIQHHAAQLGLRLQFLGLGVMKWESKGSVKKDG